MKEKDMKQLEQGSLKHQAGQNSLERGPRLQLGLSSLPRVKLSTPNASELVAISVRLKLLFYAQNGNALVAEVAPAPRTRGAHGTAPRSTSRLPFSPQPTWVITKGLSQRPQSSHLSNMLHTHHPTGRGSKFNCRLPTAPIPLGEGWSLGPFLQLTVTPPSLLQHRGPGSSHSVRV